MTATTAPTPPRSRAPIDHTSWHAPGRTDTRMQGRLLAVARGIWLGMAALSGAAYVASVLTALRQLQGACPPGVCQDDQVSPAVQHAFAALHLPVGFLVGYTLALNVGFALGFATMGVFIFSRRSRDPLALYISLTLLVFGAGAFAGDMLPQRPAYFPAWRWPVDILDFLGVAAFGVFLCIFPDGRFVPRWTLWAAVA